MQHKLSTKVKRLNRDFAVKRKQQQKNLVKFGLSENYTKFDEIFLMVLTFTK